MDQCFENWKLFCESEMPLEDTLAELLSEHQVVFGETTDPIKGFTFAVNIQDVNPIFHKARPVPFAIRTAVNEVLERMVEKDYLYQVPSSKWATPVVVVPKKNKEFRICCDFKVTLNRFLDTAAYPLPTQQDLFSVLARGKYFSKLDLSNAYLQLEVNPSTQPLLTINTHKGLFRFKRMPFGLANAPSFFQSVMDRILAGINGVICYIDDVLVSTASVEEHMAVLKTIFVRLQKHNIKLKREKCEFLRREIQYLGHLIKEDGIRPLEDKIQGLQKAKSPTNVSELRSFLGLVNYYGKFIPNLPELLEPLHKLLKKNSYWKWTGECEEAISECKRRITSEKVLVPYDATLPLSLATDASQIGVGAVLSHVIEGQEKPIMFASRTLSGTERNYSQIEREALAIIYGVTKFHQFIYGRQFTLITDHKPLVSILGPRAGIPTLSTSRLQRWGLTLAAYTYEIKFRRTQDHGNADLLSRLPVESDETPVLNQTFILSYVEDLPVTAAEIGVETKKDEVLSVVKRDTQQGWPERVGEYLRPYFQRKLELTMDGECLLWGMRVIIPSSLRKNMLSCLHETHSGMGKMKAVARSHFWWPNLDNQIECMVNGCKNCQQTQTGPNGLGKNKRKFEDTIQDTLSRILLTYETTGKTPSELFMGRSLRTRLTLIHQSLDNRVRERQARQMRYDRGRGQEEFEVDDKVWCKNFRGVGWIPGRIVGRKGSRVDTVLINGQVKTYHRDQIRRRWTSGEEGDEAREKREEEDDPIWMAPESMNSRRDRESFSSETAGLPQDPVSGDQGVEIGSSPRESACSSDKEARTEERPLPRRNPPRDRRPPVRYQGFLMAIPALWLVWMTTTKPSAQLTNLTVNHACLEEGRKGYEEKKMAENPNNRLQKFNGSKSAIRPESWIKLYDFENNSLKEDEKIKNLMYYLTDSALEWYADEIISNPAIKRWEVVKEKLIQRFGSYNANPIVSASHRRLKREESIENYFQDKIRLLNQTHLTKEEKIHLLTDGLPNDWKDLIVAAQPTDATKWFHIAASIEQNRASIQFKPKNKIHLATKNNDNRKNVCPFWCPICSKKGIKIKHWVTDCEDYDPNYKKDRPNQNTSVKQVCGTPELLNVSTLTNTPTQGAFKLININVEVNGIPAQAFVDTGATVSIINWRLFKRTRLQLQPNSDIHISQADGVTRTCGSLQTKVRIDKLIKPVTLHVMKNFKYPLLIGLDVASLFNLLIDVKDKTIYTKFDGLQNPILVNHLEEIREHELKELLEHNRNVFSQHAIDLGKVAIQHKIITKSEQPISLRPYRRPLKEYEEIAEQVKELLEHKLIRISDSPWAFPVVMVPKKDGNKRMCIDYRRLNEITLDDRQPLPHIQDMFDRLHGSRFFSTLDVAWGYWQIEMDPQSIQKTAFVTNDGHYEFLVMPFGLKNAASTFQRIIQHILGELLWKGTCSFQDDILVYTKTWQEHIELLSKVFDKLRQYNMKLKLSKCIFGRTEVKYLGHIISHNQLKPDPGKVKSIQDFPRPNTVKKVRQFMGLANYYRKFVKDFSKISFPLVRLTRKNQPFIWNEEVEESFAKLKMALSTKPVLAIYNPDYPSKVYTDASKYGIGAILTQIGPDNEEHVIAYYSKTLQPHQENYSAYEMECLAVIQATDHFHVYIENQPFEIITDHAALQWLFTMKKPKPKYFRWILNLSSKSCNIVHRSGTQQTHVDALSRLPVVNIATRELQEHQQNSDLSFLKNSHTHDGVVMIKQRGVFKAVVPNSLIKKILEEYHNSLSHPSITKTCKLITQCYWWKGITTDIKNYVRSCKSCQLVKVRHEPTLGEMITPTSNIQPLQMIGCDTIVLGIAAANTKHKFIQVFVDHATRYLWAYPTITNTAQAVTQCLDKIIKSVNSINTILTDNGKNFISKEFNKFLSLQGIKHTYTSPYHPQCNGICEKLNDTIMTKLRIAVLEKPRCKWSSLLPQVVKNYNSTPHDVTGFSPLFLMYGIGNVPEFADQTPITIEEARKKASLRTEQSRSKWKIKHDSHHPKMVETRSGKMQDPAQERIQAEESAKPQPGATIGRDASSDPVVLNPNIDIPKYDGTEDPRPWIESLEEIGFLYHWADYIISRYAAMNMTGSAKTWLNLHKASFTSWENIKIRLIQDFSLDANKEELRMKLNRMQHWNEPAIRFAEDILVLCNKVDPAMEEETKIEHVIGGLKKDVAPESVNQSKSTINGIKKLDPKYKLKINVDKIGTFEALVDTGADLSVVDLRTALDTGHGISKLAKICAGPDGKKLDMVGSIFLNIKIDDETLSHNFVILKTHLRTLILGRDFLKKMNAKIDCKQETIKYDLTNNHDEIKFEMLKIKSAKDSIVPECSMKLIKALVETEDGEYIIEESSKMFQTNGLRLARSLINVINRETHIWITNPYPRPLKIMKNQTLAFGSSPAKINVSREREVEKNEEPRFQINENLSPKEQKELKQVLERYGDLFSSRLGRTNLAKHRIDTEDAKPIKHKPYRVSAKERDIIKEQIDEMLTEGIIRPSSSPWSFPVILVKKRDGKYRFCVDYRKLNNVTVKDVYPIPRIDEVMDTLQGSTHFSAIDLRSGYWQVEVEERDKEKTAFTTAHGLYEFNVMPFGLCNAPATFERNMENMLGNLRWQICLCYLDDFIIYSPDFPTHLKRLEAVFRCFRESNLRLNDKKCRFAFEELEILGYITSKHGIKPAEHNIKAVRNFPRPKKVKEVQSFLGMCSYYRKFIKDFSKIADPLTNLIKKSVSFTWTERQEEAFQTLKIALLSPPILGHFNPNASTYVHTDASNIGIGATLVQDIGGEEKVISYLSRTLSKAEQNYSTTEKECLAVVWSMSKLRPYLYGRHFKIVTDHHALCWLKNLKDPTGRLARWALKIQEYDFDIIHKSGKKHLDADGLSRGPLPETDWDEDFERLFLNQITDEEDKFIEKKPNPEGRAWLLVVPENKKREIMKEYHNHMSNGHLGVARTMYRIKSKYFWPSMLKDVSEFVKTCHLCQSRKGSNQLPSGLLQPIPPANFPFERIGIDFVGPLPSTKNRKKWIIVLTDYYTRYAETRAVSEATVKEVSKFLVEDIFLRHGAPQYLISDRGSQFTSNLMKEVMKTCKIKHCFTTSYHPQTNGLTERLNRTLINMLSMYVNTDQKNWDEILPFITHAYNTTIQETTGYSPFFLMFGREPTSLLDDRNISVDIDKDDYDEYIKHHLDKINRTRKLVINNTIKTQERMKKNYDKKHMERSYEPGELVAVWTPIRKIGKCEKLLRKYFGPYRILKKLSNVNYLIEPKDNPGQDPLIVHVSRLKPYFERIDEVTHED
ncbi:hypothetical protein LAZ67_10003901, partial [Cordylochernes scorpioides]